MSTTDPATLAALERPTAVLLLEMDLTSTVYLAALDRDLEWGGHTYKGTYHLGSVEELNDAPGEIKPVRFMLSGVDQAFLNIARVEPIKNRRARLLLAVLDPDTHQVVSVLPLRTGSLDQMPIEFNGGECTIGATANHRGVTYARPKPVRYTDADQQRLHPGDTSMRFVAMQSQKQLTWPSVDFYKQ